MRLIVELAVDQGITRGIAVGAANVYWISEPVEGRPGFVRHIAG